MSAVSQWRCSFFRDPVSSKREDKIRDSCIISAFRNILYNKYGREVFNMWGIVIAIVSGILMSVQGVFNTQVTRQTSLWVSSSFVQCTALLVCLAAWAFTDRSSFLAVGKVQPWYMLLGGVLGALITVTVIKAMGSLGPARAAMLIVIAQLIAAYLIEVLGLFGVEKQPLLWRRVLGMGISILGIILFKW